MSFKKGTSGNPSGRPSGQQAFIDRARPFIEDYTIDGLVTLARDKERLGKLCVFDGMIVMRLVAALSKGGGRDMDSILDRVFGKSTQRIEAQETVTLAELVTGSYEYP